jgi:hypothetical protein
MFFSFFKPKKSAEPELETYNSFNYLKYFPDGLTIQTPEKYRYILQSNGFLNFQTWQLLEEPCEEEKEIIAKEAKFGFANSSLESLVDGKILSIGILPLEEAERIDEYIAESIRVDSRRMIHYHHRAEKIMKQFGQNPTATPYLSSTCFPLVILYSELGAIENGKIGIYFSEGKWQLINSSP